MTSDAVLDLSHSSVNGFTVASNNATGTNFTVRDINSAYQVTGGSGTDTITATGFVFSAAQRNAIFAAASIEKIIDQSGTYYAVEIAPTITSNGGGNTAAVSIAENTTAVTTVTATDPDLGQMLSYSISGGADAGKFWINASSGALSFLGAPDFEAPSDTDHNNGYVVQVRASDGSLFDDQVITVNVTDVSSTIIGDSGNNILNSTAETDTIDGRAGDDTAMFSQGLGNYSIQDFGSRIVVSGPDGSDTLTGVEHLRFADGTVNVDDGNSMFDTLFYMRNNLDVFHSGGNALDHFNNFGWHEGRDPNPFFDTSWYLAANSDVRASGVNPLTHYQAIGWRQGRDPGPDFDTKLYLMHNPDVAAAGVDPLAHFLQNGLLEGRAHYEAVGTPVNGFDAQYYLTHNPDVAAAGVDPLAHFNSSGWHEGRNPNAMFDTKGYLAHYSDVAAAGVNPLAHYEQFGWKEGRDPSAHFDTTGYLAANPDVAAAHVNPLDHYLTNGIYEGRAVIDDGLWG